MIFYKKGWFFVLVALLTILLFLGIKSAIVFPHGGFIFFILTLNMIIPFVIIMLGIAAMVVIFYFIIKLFSSFGRLNKKLKKIK